MFSYTTHRVLITIITKTQEEAICLEPIVKNETIKLFSHFFFHFLPRKSRALILLSNKAIWNEVETSKSILQTVVTLVSAWYLLIQYEAELKNRYI